MAQQLTFNIPLQFRWHEKSKNEYYLKCSGQSFLPYDGCRPPEELTIATVFEWNGWKSYTVSDSRVMVETFDSKEKAIAHCEKFLSGKSG